MREVKYEAWNVEEKKMIDLKAITPLALDADMNTQMAMQGMDGLFIPFSKNLILRQYTGLKDKSGKEIYEGDILFWDGSIIGAVSFVCAEYIVGEKVNARSLCSAPHEEIEVIGNIYQNPDLMEGEK